MADVIPIEAPDGGTIQFPASMTPEQITAEMRRLYPPSNSAADPVIGANSGMMPMITSTIDSPLVASQGASPYVTDNAGRYNYARAADAERTRFFTNGQVPEGHIVLRDPASGRLDLFVDNPEQREGALLRAGRVMAPGLQASPMTTGVARGLNPSAQAAATAGVDAPAGIVSNNRAVQMLEQGTALSIGGVNRIRQSYQNFETAISDRISELVRGWSGGATTDEVGTAVSRAVQRYGGRNKDVTGAMPEISAATARKSPSRTVGFSAKADALYSDFFDALGAQELILPGTTMSVLKDLDAGGPVFGELARVPIVKSMLDKLQVDGVDGLVLSPSIEEWRQFRSYVGELLGDPMLRSQMKVPQQALSQIYRAMTDDLRLAAQAKGGDVLKKFTRADTVFRVGRNRLERLLPMFENPKSALHPERLAERLTRASQEKGGHIKMLTALRRSVPDDAWDMVRGHIIGSLGQAPNTADGFSLNTFARQWNGMSDKAKAVLVGGGEYRKQLDSIMHLVGDWKRGEQLANKSNSAAYNILLAPLSFEGYQAMMTGGTNLGLTASAAGASALSGYGASRLLTAKWFVSWLSKAPDPSAKRLWASHIAKLDGLARAHPEDQAHLAEYLRALPAPKTFMGPNET